MNTTFSLRASLVVAALMALPAAHAASMTKAEHDTSKSRIESDYKAAKAACDSKSGNAKDVCQEEAKAAEKVALADLKYAYTGDAKDHNKLMETKAETAYDVAKEKCDDLSGNAKDVCVQQAKATEAKAKADAKMGKQIGEAKTDATADKRDADYKVAKEKCDALAGDAKSSCMADAKARFGKS